MLSTISFWFWRARLQLKHLWKFGHFYRRRREPKYEVLCHEHYEQRYGRKTSNNHSDSKE